MFSNLVAGGEDKGYCDVVLEGMTVCKAEYLRNTAIVQTTMEDASGNALRVTDFTPRFRRFERVFNPPQLFRRVEPISGLPRIRIRVRPTFNYGVPCTSRALGSNHIRYFGGSDSLRLTTDAALSYVALETPFALIKPVNVILGPDEPFEAAIDTASREFLERTKDYWLDWVRSLAVPLEFQADIIRAAITLKLCSFEETGAIIAAHTTSIPEAPGTQRNWDYRYCWLRDAFFVIKALNRLGATRTMEDYIHYITNIAIDAERPLRPVYGIVPTELLEERNAPNLAGFLGMGPVRVGNQAAEQLQHDTYGSVILGASQMFIDERLPRMGDADLFRRLEPLGMQACRFAMEPDAGPWEYRGRQRIHTHSATMCWVACDRLARIGGRLGTGRTGHILAGPGRRIAPGDPEPGLERAARRHCRRARPRRTGCQRLVAAGARPHSLERRALREDLPAHRQGARAQGLRHALQRRGRLRAARDGLSGLPVLVHRCAGVAWTDRRGARYVLRRPVTPQPLRLALGGHSSQYCRVVGQSAPDLLHGGYNQLGPRDLPQLAGSLGPACLE